MKIIYIIISCLLILSITNIYSQQDKVIQPAIEFEISSKNGDVIIPFEMYRDKPRMKAKVNGKDCYLMLDNGSLWDRMLFFGSPKIDSIGFKITGETFLGDSTQANALKADLSTGLTISFNDIVFKNQEAVIMRYIKGEPNVWEGLDGQISAAFFKHFVVEINYDSLFIRLIKPDKFQIDEACQVLPMKVSIEDSRTVNASIIMQDGQETTIDLLVDLGGAWPVYLPTGRNEKITLPKNAIEATLGVGQFGYTSGHLGKVKKISFGKYTLNNVLTAFIAVDKDADTYGNTMIGQPLLMRFTLFFDYPSNRLIIKPSNRYNDPFNFNMTGFNYARDKERNLLIDKIYPNSPATLIGLSKGDIITKVNGRNSKEYNRDELREMFMNEGKTINITVLKNSKIVEMKLKLESIL